MATTLNISALTDYVNVNKDELFVKSVLGGKSMQEAEVMSDVKWKESLNYLESTVNLQDGSSCGFTPDGSDTFSERYVETHPVKINKEWCHKDFRKKYMNYQLRWQAGLETLPLEGKITESNMNAIQEALEDGVWQGISSANVTGWIADVKAEDDATEVEIAEGSTMTATVDAVVAALSQRMLKKGVKIYMSYTDFGTYIKEQNATCCANRQIIDANREELQYVGDSRVTLVPVFGLEGQNILIASSKENLVVATDIEGAENVYRFWYSDDDDKFRFKVEFVLGTAVKYPDELVYTTIVNS